MKKIIFGVFVLVIVFATVSVSGRDLVDAVPDNFQATGLVVHTRGWLDFLYLEPISIASISSDITFLRFETPMETYSAYRLLRGISAVLWVEFERIAPPVGDIEEVVGVAANNDDFLSWGAEAIGACAFRRFLYESDRPQAGVIVAVIDTGVDEEHPLLEGRVLPGWNFIHNNEDTHDTHGHGTHVAGIIADITHGLDVQILPIVAGHSDGASSNFAIAQGIDWAVNSGAHVINISMGGSRSFLVDEAVLRAKASGVTVVASAGNNSSRADLRSPSASFGVITVASVTHDNRPASGSGWGFVVDIAAPGVGVYSANRDGENIARSGTSMATPHVAAAVAMYKIANPNISPAAVRRNFAGYVTVPEGWNHIRYGNGILNMERAIPQ
ncbi:MAG: S8 family serine peptidase [Defluviitaleaceae bacterium]|nr:S8 family serine peptidase [Defluviitaleaceae bacterium]